MAVIKKSVAFSDPIKPQKIIFIHPDLGIGGAERLIIDAAIGLQNRGHKVTIFTSHCDPNHCFEEAKDGTLEVRVRGNTFFPPTFLNRFHILLATLRQIHLLLSISLFSKELVTLRPDVFVVDQLPACIPLLRWLWPWRQRILFYCHFPDQLLTRRDEGGLLGVAKTAYRWPFDWFEGWSMSGSDSIVVNSNFTKGVVSSLFGGLGELGVVYPCVDTDLSAKIKSDVEEKPLWGGTKVLLSINRFERKKDVGLAVKAFHGLAAAERKHCRLVVAGGYDPRVQENVQYHKELLSLADSLGLSTATAKTVPSALAIPETIEVLFLLSVPGPFKSTLLRSASLLVYTPTNEHFGIVPVEAMYEGVPVLAANSGGPLETVIEGKTGWLRDVTQVELWTEVMRKVLVEMSSAGIEEMGRNGKKRVHEEFSRTIMAKRLEDVIVDITEARRKRFLAWRDVQMALGVIGIFVAGVIAAYVRGPPKPKPLRPQVKRRWQAEHGIVE